MKKIVFTLVCLSGLSFASFAQQPNQTGTNTQGQHNNQGGGHSGQGQKQTAAQKAEKLTQYMTTSLNLTTDQQSKVSALNLSKATQIDNIRTKYKDNMEAAKPELKVVKTDYNTSLNAILTPEQQTKWEALKKQKKEELQQNKTAGAKPAEGTLTPEDIE